MKYLRPSQTLNYSMTADEIQKRGAPLRDDLDQEQAFIFWLKEIAYQLAVQNEQLKRLAKIANKEV